MSSPLDKLIATCVEPMGGCNDFIVGYIESYHFKNNDLMVGDMYYKNDGLTKRTYSIKKLKLADPEEIITVELRSKIEKLKEIINQINSLKDSITF